MTDFIKPKRNKKPITFAFSEFHFFDKKNKQINAIRNNVIVEKL